MCLFFGLRSNCTFYILSVLFYIQDRCKTTTYHLTIEINKFGQALMEHCSNLLKKYYDAKLFVAKGKDNAIKCYAKPQTISVNGDNRADVEDRLNSVASMAKSLSDVINSEQQWKIDPSGVQWRLIITSFKFKRRKLVLKCLPLQKCY